MRSVIVVAGPAALAALPWTCLAMTNDIALPFLSSCLAVLIRATYL